MAREGLLGVNTGVMNPDAGEGNRGQRVPRGRLAWGWPAGSFTMNPMLSFPAAEMRSLRTSSPTHWKTGTATPAARRASTRPDIDPDERTAAVDLGLAGARRTRVWTAPMQERPGTRPLCTLRAGAPPCVNGVPSVEAYRVISTCEFGPNWVKLSSDNARSTQRYGRKRPAVRPGTHMGAAKEERGFQSRIGVSPELLLMVF